MERTKTQRTLRMLMTILLALVVAFAFIMPQNTYAAVKISKSKMTLTVGTKGKLKVSGTKKTIKWASTRENIATVSSKGVIKAKSAGKATIFASYGTGMKTCTVTVVDKLKTPTVIYKKYIKAQKKVIIGIKNNNDVAVSATVKMIYVDAANTMMEESQYYDVNIIEPGKTFYAEFNANLAPNSNPNAWAVDVAKASSRYVSKVDAIKITPLSKTSEGASYTIENTSSVNLTRVWLLVLFKNSSNQVGGCSKVAVDSLKAGEKMTVLAARPDCVPSNAIYYVSGLCNYAYAK